MEAQTSEAELIHERRREMLTWVWHYSSGARLGGVGTIVSQVNL